jgi:8-oxo-dGTP diphosphatase
VDEISRPRIGVSAIIRDDAGRVLLVRRGKDPGRGLYAFPGGSLEFGETLREGAAREAREETGITVTVLDLLYLSEVMPTGDGGLHFVLLDFGCEVAAGHPMAASDADDVRWVDRSTVRDVPLTVNMADALASAPVRRFLGWP